MGEVVRNVFITLIAFISFTVSAQSNNITSKLKFIEANVDVGRNGGEALIINEGRFHKRLYKEFVEESLELVRDSGCSYQLVIGRKNLQAYLGSFALFSKSKKAQKVLIELLQNDQVLGAYGYFWNGDKGESEYCSTESLNIYFTNGQALLLSFDSTT